MRLLLLAMLLAWQASGGDAPPKADAVHLRYERAVTLAAGAEGQACAVLDADVYAHAAEASARDVRLFATAANGAQRETPYVLSESETQPASVESAAVRNLGVRNGEIVFDLAMPARPYSAVELNLDAQDFVATAKVSGSGAGAGVATELGSFTLFDLTKQHLARSTTLPLQESTFPLLHVALRLTQSDGRAWTRLDPAIVAGASVPPSREAQVLYTPVARSTEIATKERSTVVRFATVPPHVPVERVRFEPAAGYKGSFLRAVVITARPLNKGQSDGATESVGREIAVIHRAASDAAPAVQYESLSVNATLGANLAAPAEVRVTVENGDDAPLPLAAVYLEMRRRSVCFDAAPGVHYTLRYGDAALAAPTYDYARLFAPSGHPIAAQLEPERENPAFLPRAERRPYTERHPEFVWVGLLIVIAALGLTALESVKRQRHR